jgi:hypothetical protein
MDILLENGALLGLGYGVCKHSPAEAIRVLECLRDGVHMHSHRVVLLTGVITVSRRMLPRPVCFAAQP